jgi:hypothetical protein
MMEYHRREIKKLEGIIIMYKDTGKILKISFI